MQDPHLIVTIVRKGWGEVILEATMAAGAHGGTIIPARGVGKNEQQRVFGIQIEPEKEIVLTLVPATIKAEILRVVERAGELDAPGRGLAFTLRAEDVVGIVHLVTDQQP
jgi:nitrogen regulatory protein P-II 1